MKEPEGVARPGLAAAGWHFIAIWLVVRVHCLLVSWPLYYSDFVLEYPYLVGDGPDIILNGLFIAGETVPYSGRPPLLPLVDVASSRARSTICSGARFSRHGFTSEKPRWQKLQGRRCHSALCGAP